MSRAVTGGPARGEYVLWVSTARTTRGGVASMVNTTLATDLSDRWRIVHLATHRDGSTAVKIGAFVVGFAIFVWLVVCHRPRLVHVHMSSYGSFVRKSILIWIARAVRIPVIVHVHGAEFHLFHRSLPRLMQTYVTRTLSTCAAVIALGPSWSDRLTAIAPRARVVVIPNSVRPRSPVVRPIIGRPVNVLFLGRVGERKGAFDLIEAWHGMVADGTPAHLTVAGDGDVDRARVLTVERGVATSVDVPGWIAPAAIPDLVAAAHVLVLPSHDEGQPMAVLEAMAAGLCVVTSPVGGIPDLVDETSAVFVTPGDVDGLRAALTRVVGDADEREALGHAALARVHSTFDVDVVWRRIDALYTEVVG